MGVEEAGGAYWWVLKRGRRLLVGVEEAGDAYWWVLKRGRRLLVVLRWRRRLLVGIEAREAPIGGY